MELRLEELLAQGAKYVDVVDKDAQTKTRYCAAPIGS